MTIGDDAVEAGMTLVSPTDLVTDGPDQHNLTRDYIAQRMLLDSGWTNVTIFGTGWTGTAGGFSPRVRRVGDRVFLAGAVTRGTSATAGDIITLPVGYRPVANAFIGVVIANNGTVHQFTVSPAGVVGIPPGYSTGNTTPGDILPTVGAFFVD